MRLIEHKYSDTASCGNCPVKYHLLHTALTLQRHEAALLNLDQIRVWSLNPNLMHTWKPRTRTMMRSTMTGLSTLAEPSTKMMTMPISDADSMSGRCNRAPKYASAVKASVTACRDNMLLHLNGVVDFAP